jgi:PHD/YefM family antitoxin component YafN of YafNO toxin-antitoxin module
MGEDLELVHDNGRSGAEASALSIADCEGCRETLYLLSEPANVRRLREGIAQLDTGLGTERALIEP